MSGQNPAPACGPLQAGAGLSGSGALLRILVPALGGHAGACRSGRSLPAKLPQTAGLALKNGLSRPGHPLVSLAAVCYAFAIV